MNEPANTAAFVPPAKVTEPGLPWPLLRSVARIADAPLFRIAALLREAVQPLAGGNALVIFTEECTGRLQKRAGDEDVIAKLSIDELQQLRASLTGTRPGQEKHTLPA